MASFVKRNISFQFSPTHKKIWWKPQFPPYFAQIRYVSLSFCFTKSKHSANIACRPAMSLQADFP